MKFTNIKGNTSTIRKVWTSDKEVCFGLVGTVKDLLKEKIFTYCDYPKETWAFVPAPGITQEVTFGKTRTDALKNLIKTEGKKHHGET